ncbi:hypothetical protein BKE38_09085 [Pseudoroseomonas deserti]|uniref:Uncharacterized protein n=1 Tax=Teichococcus deserti TaxID=1817963 RepID=A0A1V2H3M1_9PROT|nr:hypothetical protein [Pseudoroseomonas deserti]ONG55485.1 hypothetical protein BKE38_09085 [Pseudoroseomonas deserti]
MLAALHFTPPESRAIAIALAPLRLPPPSELLARRRRGQAGILVAASLEGQGAACLVLDPHELWIALESADAESLGGLSLRSGRRMMLRDLLRAALAEEGEGALAPLRRPARAGEAPPSKKLTRVLPEGRLRMALLALPGRGLLNLLA